MYETLSTRMESGTKGFWSCVWTAAMIASSWTVAPVQAAPSNFPRDLSDTSIVAAAEPSMITSNFAAGGQPAEILIHDTNGKVSWKWTINDAGSISAKLRECMTASSAVAENRYVDDGRSILSIYGFALVIINHHPGQATDKRLTFGVCINRDDMGNSHAAEIIPDNKIALATTNGGKSNNIKIFNRGNNNDPMAGPIQSLHGIPGVHALIWDGKTGTLWAAGNDRDPQSRDSQSILNAYHYNRGSFDASYKSWVIAKATHLTAEWGANTPWWDGSHSMTPIPGQNKLMITTDLDVHVFDRNSKTFEHGEVVVNKYLKGFQQHGRRVGAGNTNLPRSDIKSVDIHGNGNALFVQAKWGETFGEFVSVLIKGKQHNIINKRTYRSRWFAPTQW